MKNGDEPKATAPPPDSADPFDIGRPNYTAFYQPGARTTQEFHLSRKLILTSRRWMQLIDSSLNAVTGQNRARWQTLFSIAFARPPVTTMTLSTDRSVRWPTLVRTLGALEKDGLITRRDNPADGRSRIIELTQAGRDMLTRVQPVIDTTRAAVLADLSIEEVTRMTELLDLMLGRIEQRLTDEDGAEAD